MLKKTKEWLTDAMWVSRRETNWTCEKCGEDALVLLNGRQSLCWNHYVEIMQLEREKL